MSSAPSHSHSETQPQMLAHHPPAVKVAGRRLSTSGRRIHGHGTGPARDSTSKPTGESDSESDGDKAKAIDDYPRPAAPGSSPTTTTSGGGFDIYGRRPEHALHGHSVAKPSAAKEETKAGKDALASHGNHGRIAQPAGHALDI